MQEKEELKHVRLGQNQKLQEPGVGGGGGVILFYYFPGTLFGRLCSAVRGGKVQF